MDLDHQILFTSKLKYIRDQMRNFVIFPIIKEILVVLSKYISAMQESNITMQCTIEMQCSVAVCSDLCKRQTSCDVIVV